MIQVFDFKTIYDVRIENKYIFEKDLLLKVRSFFIFFCIVLYI
jgi:hypothetical protein